MSAGLRAEWTKATSRGSPRSWKVRAIAIIGVTPLPPDRSRYFCAGWVKQEKSPIGPSARTVSPAFRVSCSQFETGPPGTRLTVIDRACGRVGAEEIV